MRRPLVRNSLLGAIATARLPAVVVLRDLGPLPGDDAVPTRCGRRACASSATSSGSPISPSDMEIGDLINAEPDVVLRAESDGEPRVEGADLPRRRPRPR